MSGSATPNLDLEYLDSNQSQPEVKINDAWNKIDAAVAGGVTIEDANSPFTSVPHAKVLRIAGGTVTAESDSTALITLDGSGGGGNVPLWIPGRRGREGDRGRRGMPGSNGTSGANGFNGRRGEDGQRGRIGFPGAAGANGATGATGSQQPPGAYWTTLTFGAAVSLPVNPVPRIITGTYNIKRVVVLTQGGPGSLVINLWKANISAHYPPIVTDDITGGANIPIVSANTHDDSVLTGWNTGVIAGDVLLFTLASTSAFTYIEVSVFLG